MLALILAGGIVTFTASITSIQAKGCEGACCRGNEGEDHGLSDDNC
jgi:hypothetical protein